MVDKKSEKQEEERKEADIHLDLGLGGLFKQFEELIHAANKLKDTTKTNDLEAETNLSHGSVTRRRPRTMRDIWDGRSRPQGKGRSFGNIRETKDVPIVEEVREPMVDIFDEETEIIVVTELPGVAENNIKYEVKDDILTITVEAPREYRKEILLPAPVDADNILSAYNNGMLELKLKKKGIE
ncbi:Hsp20/alpha crystallin family protein [bacterium]|nr:Hsp20/alpha crystallin family protein [bacterium]